MRALHAVASLAASTGGPAVVVPALVHQLSSCGIDVDVVAQRRRADTESPAWASGPNYHFAATSDGSKFGYSSEAARIMRRLVEGSDLVHSHGVWMHINYLSAGLARRLNRPHLITVHGMLEPWAVRYRRFKKIIAWRLFQHRAIARASCLHALTENEAGHIRRLGIRTPIAVVPNGVELPQTKLSREVLESRHPELRDKRWIVFCSRVHPKKGLIPLAEAWGSLAGRHRDHHLVVAGPDEGSFWPTVERRLQDMRLSGRYTYTGMLTPEYRDCALANADVFVLPSYSEGFSLAVLEALAHSCPVLITPYCNFPEAQRGGAGLECEPRPDSIAAGLESLLRLTERERSAMGERGRELVATKFSWKSVAARMSAIYYWLSGKAEMPSDVAL